jgi:fructoselysine-6-P-deglycase FrlB-like protein
MSNFAHELTTQPAMWRRAAELASDVKLLPPPGARVAFIGCGTSLYMAQAAAAYRNERMLGDSDAFPASEVPAGRAYDAVVVISRSGTTTEVLEAVAALPAGTQTLAVTAEDGNPLADIVSGAVVLSFANEQSVVQTRFATSALSLLLAHCGWEIEGSAARAEEFLAGAPPEQVDLAEHFVFLGRGVAAALANEAALKLREVLGAWTESYPTMEYRHGPISAAGERTLVWALDQAEPAIDKEVTATGATVLRSGNDPLASLVLVHRAVEHLATKRKVDPDRPRHLARSIVLVQR